MAFKMNRIQGKGERSAPLIKDSIGAIFRNDLGSEDQNV